MEINPIGSKDVLHGVPTLYKEILSEITDHVDRAVQNPDAAFAEINVEYTDNVEPQEILTTEEDRIFTQSFTRDDDETHDDADQEDFFKSMFKT
tara:strand:+ start:1230 stop:1511 length:282 start_codon:yes stop_codon:yes gene_type:complete